MVDRTSLSSTQIDEREEEARRIDRELSKIPRNRMVRIVLCVAVILGWFNMSLGEQGFSCRDWWQPETSSDPILVYQVVGEQVHFCLGQDEILNCIVNGLKQRVREFLPGSSAGEGCQNRLDFPVLEVFENFLLAPP